MRWFFVAIILTLFAAVSQAGAQEFTFLVGMMNDSETRHRTYSWQLDYREARGEHLAVGLTYLNEGHIPNHHRDGASGQLWARTGMYDKRAVVSAGIGPYYYFDTARTAVESPYRNDHGWGVLTSIAVNWYSEGRWFLQLRNNWAETGHMDTVTTLLGVGWRLDASPPAAAPSPQNKPVRQDELTVFLGRTIVNSFGSEHAVAKSVEYRKALWKYLDWTAGWLDEGETVRTNRHGPFTQLWAVKAFFGDMLTLGIGGGVYYAIDHLRDPLNGKDNDRFFAGIFTMSAGYAVHPPWGLRVSWDRVNTNYDRDSDVIKMGISYWF